MENTRHKIGDYHSIAGIPRACLLEVSTIDGLDYELWRESVAYNCYDKRGIIRILNIDPLETISVVKYPRFVDALSKFFGILHTAYTTCNTTT